MRPHCYQASGRVPALAGPAFICSLVCAGLGAFLYAWVTLYGGMFPALCLMWAFPAWLVLVVRSACHLGRIRNPGVMRQFGLVVGFVGWTVQWTLWIVFATHDSVRSMPGQSLAIPIADLLAEPAAFHRGLSIAVAATTWRDGDWPMWFRSVSWLAELCLLLIPPAKAGFAQAGQPYCEAWNRWATVTDLPYFLAAETLVKARSYLAGHPAQLLAALIPLRRVQDSYATVTVYTGKHDSFISVVVHSLKFEAGHAMPEELVIAEQLRVSSRDISTLVTRLSDPPARKS